MLPLFLYTDGEHMQKQKANEMVKGPTNEFKVNNEMSNGSEMMKKNRAVWHVSHAIRSVIDFHSDKNEHDGIHLFS